MSEPQIIFEDEYLLVINKPAGVVVNRADTTVKVETIQDWTEGKYNVSPAGETEERKLRLSRITYNGNEEVIKEFKDRSGIVHRLDKDTSGILVIAKTPQAFEKLKNQFKGREVVKKYQALVHGKVEPPQGEIDAPIERSPFNRKHFGVFPGGREAVTDYRSITGYVLRIKGNNEPLTLLEITPHTGRTHQIRVHLKYLNHPIVSDPIYGGRKNVQSDIKFCPRLFLHAAYLKIYHPVTHKPLEFTSMLPPDLQTVLDNLS